ncbi:MAG: toxic anion resistance protein [Ilumatobacter sp.]|uniref:toxic anion resistance protein n=1 Tax=Ilumatobacter sp. TaxID=1967498 RepID=UPI0039198406
MTNTASTPASNVFSLDLDVESAKTELALPEPEPTDTLREQANAQVERLLAVDPTDEDARAAARDAFDTMGRELQSRSATRSQMLQAPLKDIARNSEDGGEVAKSLGDLRIEVEKLDPSGLDTDAGWFTRAVGKIPGVGTPLKRYFMRYESSQTQIDAIVKSLEKGRDQLKRDNVTLVDDQKRMRELTIALTDQIALAGALDAAFVDKLNNEITSDDPRRQFIEEDILFTLRQRTLDLQQQLAVNQQGVLAVEIIIRNNRELIRGVDRALDVTISALQVAVTVALALAHQKIVLDKIAAVNATTSSIIAGTAERLKTQGAEIHQQASSTMLDMTALRAAFDDIDIALEEISRYRREALPTMASTILELDQLTAESEQAIVSMESGRAAATKIGAGADVDADEIGPSGSGDGGAPS